MTFGLSPSERPRWLSANCRNKRLNFAQCLSLSQCLRRTTLGRIREIANQAKVEERALEPLHRHRLFGTTDLDEGEQFASQIWERNHSTISDGRYGLRWNEASGEKIKLSYIELDCALRLKTQGPLSDNFRIFFHRDGRIGH